MGCVDCGCSLFTHGAIRFIYLFITGQAALEKRIYKDLRVLASYNDLRVYSNVSKLLVNKFKSVGSILRNGTERNDGLNHGTERFLQLKLATYHC